MKNLILISVLLFTGCKKDIETVTCTFEISTTSQAGSVVECEFEGLKTTISPGKLSKVLLKKDLPVSKKIDIRVKPSISGVKTYIYVFYSGGGVNVVSEGENKYKIHLP